MRLNAVVGCGVKESAAIGVATVLEVSMHQMTGNIDADQEQRLLMCRVTIYGGVFRVQKEEACQIGSKAAGALVLIWQAAQPVKI